MQYDVVAGKITIENVQAFLRELDAIAHSSNTTIQAADATKIAGRRHVDYSVVSRSSKHRYGPWRRNPPALERLPADTKGA